MFFTFEDSLSIQIIIIRARRLIKWRCFTSQKLHSAPLTSGAGHHCRESRFGSRLWRQPHWSLWEMHRETHSSPTYPRRVTSDEETPPQNKSLRFRESSNHWFLFFFFYIDLLFAPRLCVGKAPVCSVIRVSSAKINHLPRLVTILSTLSIMWKKNLSLTYPLKCALSFPGEISSSEVKWSRHVGSRRVSPCISP